MINSPFDIKVISYYKNEILESFPEKNTVSFESISCDKGASATFNTKTWNITVSNLTDRGTKCSIYFKEKGPLLKNAILAGKDIQERTDFSTTLSTNTNEIIYQETTNDGTTYYFAGDTNENWVSFADFYWRIIRINEDGSIRMIYNGTTTTQTGTQLQTSVYNSLYDNNAYVGYMYTLNQVHGLGTDSEIKEVIDKWYEDNILDTQYEQYISMEAGFCNDRTPYSGTGTGINATTYAAYNRLVTNKTPSFRCTNSNDLFTVTGSSKGNGTLTYPIGLITADEVAYAGGVWGTNNTSYYLYTGQNYWTMSPYNVYISGSAVLFIVNSDGNLAGWDGHSARGVRPVINLDASVSATGLGTIDNPYVVE